MKTSKKMSLLTITLIAALICFAEKTERKILCNVNDLTEVKFNAP